MTTKPYKYDEAEAGKPQCVSEPAVSYVASRNAASLKLEAIDELMKIFDTDRLARAVDFLRSLGREEEDLMPGGIPTLQFTKEELNAHIDKSLQDIAEGHVCTSAEVHRRMEEKFPFLCK